MSSYNYCKISFYMLAALFSEQKTCHGSRAHQSSELKDYPSSYEIIINFHKFFNTDWHLFEFLCSTVLCHLLS